MKELSVEEKAKRFDEAIEVARMIKNGEPINVPDGTPIPIAIFPELKESEDEKIRKAIYNCVKWFGFDSCFFKDVSQEECLAWLEKQGEAFTKKDVDDAYLKGVCDAKQELEKQGEQKSAFEMKTPEESLGIDSDTYNKIVDECIYGEQKPTDKVEPKFHEGDWIVHHGTENLYQVVAVIDNQYQLKYGDTYTVQKCADVDRCASCLKPTDKVEPKFKVGDIITPKDGGHEPWQIMQVDISDKKYRFKDGYVIHFSHEDNYELVEQKPSWSEEDKKMSRFIGNAITADGASEYLESKGIQVIDAHVWLDELKDRVQPQNKWQESLATADLENSLCDIQDEFSDTSYEYRTLGEAIEFIRCTESKPHWKPSEEDLIYLKRAAENYDFCDGERTALMNLYNELKKL